MVVDKICPLCKTGPGKAVSKNYENLRKCVKCGVVFNNAHRELVYDDRYFLDDYKKQYGKTYIEDFDNIYGISLKRIERIRRLIDKEWVKSDLKLLDIGSAAGFFLKAARDMGFGDVSGCEISKYAGEYCRNEFDIEVINSSFEDADTESKYDVITAWYFIEHGPDPADNIRKIFNLLNEKGILALSVPSISGPQFIFNREKWAKDHPADHRVDFSPASAKRFLENTGFRRIKIYPGGIHPERIYPQNITGFRAFSALYSKFAGLFSFSDTMEIYAVK